MKATWKKTDTTLTLAFILALLFGGSVKPSEPLNKNQPQDVEAIRDDALDVIIDEGRRQIDAQAERFRHVTDRAQTLLTVSLVAVAFAASIFGRLQHADGGLRVVATLLWSLGGVLLLIGVATAAATVVVRAEFDSIDATQMTHWMEPAIRKLAGEYSEAVILGETTVAARVTVFRQATRFVGWGVIIVAIALLLTQ
jgi:hypothetical protein